VVWFVGFDDAADCIFGVCFRHDLEVVGIVYASKWESKSACRGGNLLDLRCGESPSQILSSRPYHDLKKIQPTSSRSRKRILS
jgi:hypothetical protein